MDNKNRCSYILGICEKCKYIKNINNPINDNTICNKSKKSIINTRSSAITCTTFKFKLYEHNLLDLINLLIKYITRK